MTMNEIPEYIARALLCERCHAYGRHCESRHEDVSNCLKDVKTIPIVLGDA
jgi:hypothetical protein